MKERAKNYIGVGFVKRYSRRINTVLLLIHLMMLFLYKYLHISELVVANIFSVTVYGLLYIAINKKRFSLYIRCCYLEISVYMCYATICLGTRSGFLLYCMSCIPILYYSDYMGRKIGSKKKLANIYSAVSIGSFYIAVLWNIYHKPLYLLDDKISYGTLLLNAFFVFSFLVVFMNANDHILLRSEQSIYAQANEDELTGLRNRAYLYKHVDEIYFKETAHNYWLFIADIDDFKHINDTYGHVYGDYVLKKLAHELQLFFKDDTVYRWGGEEFVVIGDAKGDFTNISNRLADFMNYIHMTDFSQDGKGKSNVTVTIGVAFGRDEDNYDEWFSRADHALYEGKKGTKDCICFDKTK